MQWMHLTHVDGFIHIGNFQKVHLLNDKEKHQPGVN